MKRLISTILASFMVFTSGLALVPAVAMAQTTDAQQEAACEGIELTGGSCTPASGEATVNSTIETVINILSIAVGVISVIMIIIGGLKYIMSTGDSNSVNSAKNTILYAIIGLVIVATAQLITRFVINQIG